jgi:hypothetical protein
VQPEDPVKTTAWVRELTCLHIIYMLLALALVPDSLCPTSIRVFTFIFSVSVSVILRYSSNLFVMCWISFFVVLVYTPTCTFALYTHSALVINHSDLNIDIYRFGRYKSNSDWWRCSYPGCSHDCTNLGHAFPNSPAIRCCIGKKGIGHP